MAHSASWKAGFSFTLAAGGRALARVLVVSIIAVCATAPASADDRGGPTVRVMTQNLYQGANFDSLLAAGTFPAFLAAAGQALQDIRTSKPTERAAAVAREIVRNRVDLVGLQEAVIVRTGPLNNPLTDPAGAAVPETRVESDGLQFLLTELRKLGEPYDIVAIVPGLDAQVPTALGLDARLTVRTVVIARSRGSDLRLSNIQVQGFLRNRSFTSVGGPILNPRGWASMDVDKGGRKFRLVATHLEEPDPVQPLQAYDMINGAGNTSLPLIFIGDFNVTATNGSDPTYVMLTNAGFVDAWMRRRPLDPGFTCCQNPDLLNPASLLDERIDLVLFRGAFQVEDIRLVGDKPSDRTASGLWPSDHAGVVATLRLPRHGD